MTHMVTITTPYPYSTSSHSCARPERALPYFYGTLCCFVAYPGSLSRGNAPPRGGSKTGVLDQFSGILTGAKWESRTIQKSHPSILDELSDAFRCGGRGPIPSREATRFWSLRRGRGPAAGAVARISNNNNNNKQATRSKHNGCI